MFFKVSGERANAPKVQRRHCFALLRSEQTNESLRPRFYFLIASKSDIHSLQKKQRAS